jgi:hypothetical protein
VSSRIGLQLTGRRYRATTIFLSCFFPYFTHEDDRQAVLIPTPSERTGLVDLALFDRTNQIQNYTHSKIDRRIRDDFGELW